MYTFFFFPNNFNFLLFFIYRMFISRLNDLDEENNAIQEGFHPTLSKQMDEVEEKHRALTLRAEKRRDYHKNAIEAVFASQEKQIRDEFLVGC